jgi:D-serine deaminase-like pyridoxal phosphate-dependent protein
VRCRSIVEASAGGELVNEGVWDMTVPGGLDTPALMVDVERLQRNIDSMADAMKRRSVALRPHAKTHKSAEIAEMQISAGAAGLTVATLGEAEAFARAGFDDLFIAYPLWAGDSIAERLNRLSRDVRLRVGVESEPSACALASASPGLEVLVELDCGQHRTGVSPIDAVTVAGTCAGLGLEVIGVFTHGGHGYSALNAVTSAAHDELNTISEAVELLTQAGFDVKVASAGSTPTALGSASGPVNEERPGCYVFYDRQQMVLGACGPQDVAAFVAATVVSTTAGDQFVIDAGSKALSSDRPAWLDGYGLLPGCGHAVVSRVWEHHGVVQSQGTQMPEVGDVVAVVPNHICTVVNLFDSYVLTSGGEVVGRWEVTARGR